MNNILFCISLVTEGTLMDDYSAGALGFYDLETLELTDNVSGKDFGIVGTSLLAKESVINIPDIHLLNAVSATIPLNVSYGITIEAAELEEESTDTSDVELIILHKNVAPNGDWRQFITIPYAEFEGDTDNLLDIIVARLNDLADKGKLEGVQVNDVADGVIQLYVNNIDQYEIITKSELLDISDPSGYKPVVAPTKLIDLIDKNTASWGIWHREEDDDWFKYVSSNVSSAEYDTIISIRYVTSRKASVTHDEPIYNTLHILTTTELASDIMNIVQPSQDSQDSQVTSISINDDRTGTIILTRKSSQDADNHFAWSNGMPLELVVYTTSESPVVGDLTYIKDDSTFVAGKTIVAINE